MLNALLNTASGATWVSLHHGGGVGMGYSQHAGMVIVADGTDDAARRLERVLWNDPATGVMRHADAGYDEAIDCAREQGLDLPMVTQVIILTPGTVTLDTLRTLWTGAPAASPTKRSPRSTPPPPRSTASSPAARPSTASTPASACSPRPASPPTSSAELQRNLILSHSCGLGDALPRNTVRLMIVLKLIGLGRGHCGVRRDVIDALMALLDADAMPLIPAQGSVGASGDLAPLAHLVAALMGEGRIDLAGEILPAAQALDRMGRDPLVLAPKEGLALINGTQASTAIALDALFLGQRVFAAAIHAGALSVDALKGSIAPFDDRIHAAARPARPDRRRRADPRPARRQRDRHQPPRLRPGAGPLQLPLPAAGHGRSARPPHQRRAHAGDRGQRRHRQPDPLPRISDEVISGGNFHAQPVAFAADIIAMALCEVGSISERRTSVLVDPNMSRLPAFLTDDGGLNSGLMIPQVTAAALVSENKSLAFPASVDSIPTSAGQEDHVSMAPIAARKAVQIASNAAGVIAIELIAAAQGVDYHAPLKTSAKLQARPRQGPRPVAPPPDRPLLGRRNGRAAERGAGGRNWRRRCPVIPAERPLATHCGPCGFCQPRPKGRSHALATT